MNICLESGWTFESSSAFRAAMFQLEEPILVLVDGLPLASS
jgi:hypothetical protein